MKNNEWQKAQEFEKDWWGNCANTFGEETKQFLYADRMGLKTFHNGKSPFNFDIQKSILDIGGGPVSLLLKCKYQIPKFPNFRRVVTDPLKLPNWAKERYEKAGIEFYDDKGEDINSLKTKFDEVWIYNVLQHTENPEKVIQNAKKVGRLIRIFEWIDTGTSDGHIHNLTEEKLNKWLGGEGKVEQLKGQNTCFGKCYYGVFKGL